jgi:predicted Zn-dependent peptidase
MKIKFRFLAALLATVLFFSCAERKDTYKTISETDSNGYKYERVTNDPLNTRIYTLENGLKVYLSRNTDQPRIMTLIGVRAGSVNDPTETTGLAHYFEHMMFKGSDEFGTKNWEKEKELLDRISDLFEKHKSTDNKEEKKNIYTEIDKLSQEASKYAISNEYVKMLSTIGAKSTNAGTSYDLTVYLNDIPSNELEKWIKMEFERFKDPVLRLFHTELETVYEEFNMSQDNDQRRLFQAMMNGMFPEHPLGRSVLGYPEHLKNPSMENIMEFYRTWYVPNNMSVILSGDIDYNEAIKLVDATFGQYKAQDLPEIKHPVQNPLESPIEKHVYGPDAEFVRFAYLFDGYNSEDRKYVTMIDNILSNAVAGLIDLNLNQKQKVLRAGSGSNFFNEYGMHFFYGMPREGQSLEELRDLILAEIEKVKNGEFDEWLIEATVNNLRLSAIRNSEEYNRRAYNYLTSFIAGSEWSDELKFLDELEKITKEELIAYAKEHYKDNYVIAYKHTGEAKGLVKVDKPEITPIEINRTNQSEFFTEFRKITNEPIEPVFVDFDEQIKEQQFSDGIIYNQVDNTTNELFEFEFIFDMGKNHDPKIGLAVNYLPYLGTDKYSAEDFKKELYKLGIELRVRTSEKRSFVWIEGLDDNFEKGLKLLEHLFANAKPDQEAYDKFVEGELKKRSDKKLNQHQIRNALQNYARYGKDSPFTNIIPEDELRAINPEQLTDIIHSFTNYPHRIFYYGPRETSEVVKKLKKHHITPSVLKELQEPRLFRELTTDKDKVYFVNYDKSQVDVSMYSKGVPFDVNTYVDSRLFNQYYGRSMSSVVFTEIREARALAYAAWAGFNSPRWADKSFFINSIVFTQADKMMDAVDAMDELLDDFVEDERLFRNSKESVLKNIQTERVIKSRIFWNWHRNQNLGIDYDIRKDIYEKIQQSTIDDVEDFFEEHIEDKNYTYMIVGNKNMADLDALKKIGPVEELSLEDIFNY